MSPPNRNHDRDDFPSLFRAGYRPVLAYALRRTDAHRAHDIAAEVFVIAWGKRDRCPHGDEATAWLLGIARNVLRNHDRTARRQDRLARRVAALPAEHAEAADARMGGSDLQDALAQLPPAQAEILRLAYWDDLSNRQIGQVLRIPEGVVAVRLSRARRRLRLVLSADSTATRTAAAPPLPTTSIRSTP